MRYGRSTLVSLALAVLLAVAGAAPAAGTGPVTLAAAGPVTPDSQLRQDVYGFFLPSEMDHVLTRADLGVLTTIAYFGLVARSGGGLARRTNGSPDARWTAWRSDKMRRVIKRAHDAGVEVALTVTRFAWDAAGQRSSIQLLSNSKARARLVQEIVEQVWSRGVDGVNIDFEPIPASQKQHFVTFVRALRRGLDGYRTGLDLTVAATGFVANYDVRGLTQPGAADAIFIMAYHYRGSWSTSAGSIAPLSRNGYDLADTIAAYRKEAPARKLILGLPYYGYIWSTQDGSVRADTQSGSRVGYPASIIYRHAVTLAAKYGTRWDPTEQGPWVRWKERACGSCALVWRQMYFDNARSFGLKLDLAVAQGLRGVGIWTLGYEGTRTELNDALRDKLGGD